jgi:hypothetical protein
VLHRLLRPRLDQGQPGRRLHRRHVGTAELEAVSRPVGEALLPRQTRDRSVPPSGFETVSWRVARP